MSEAAPPRRSKLRVVLALSGVLLLLGGIYVLFVQDKAADPAQGQRAGGRRRMGGDGPVSVEVAKVEQRDMPVLREGIGSVQANAFVTVRAQVEGVLTEVAFTEGQMVKRGDILARIDPVTYKAALDQAQAKKAQDEATLANARLDLNRYAQLAASNAGSRQQADQQRAVVAQLEAQVRADQAALESARATLGYTTITAPIDGRTGLRVVDPGNIIRASDAAGLVSIAQIQPIAVVFTLPQRDLAAVTGAMKAGEVKVEALGTDARTALASGILTVIDNQIDSTTGTVKLKARFANTDSKLWPGQFVSVRVRIALVAGARVVPTPAIRRGPQGTFVYVLENGERVKSRPVTVAQQDENLATLSGGLEAGEQVVTAGFARLTDGKAVLVAQDPARVGAAPASQPRASGQRRRRSEGGQKPAPAP